MSITSLFDEAKAILPELHRIRRELHTFPELGNDLPRTQAYVLKELDGLPLEITTGKALTSIVAVLRGTGDGPAVLLRGDMDGLPVTEETGLPFASTNGNMHACGHDLHTAGLIGAVRLLSAHRDSFAGSVVFMFQPGEEGASGAKYMVEEGVLDAAGSRVCAAFGLHVQTGIPLGEIWTRKGPLMAGSNNLHITVKGRGGHGSIPSLSRDPVPALAEIVSALQAYTTRRVNVFDPAVLTVTQLSAGTAINVIPDSATLGATVRALSEQTTSQLEADLPLLADGIAAAHGCEAETSFSRLYPATINDADVTERSLPVLRELVGDELVKEIPNPFMGSEDFSFVLQEVPGMFAMIGAGPTDPVRAATAPTNHSARAFFDDAVLAEESAALAALALDRLG